MMKSKKKLIRRHLQNLNDNWYEDELIHYAECFDEENPEQIETEFLKEHNYKDLRMLMDYFNKEGVFTRSTLKKHLVLKSSENDSLKD